MLRMKVILLLMSFFFSFSLFAQNRGVRFMDNEPWESVMKEAQKQNKLIFVDCYTSWCGPCKQLAAEVFPREDIGEYINDKFVSVKYDVERGEGLAFVKKHEGWVTAYPTLLLMDGEGKLIQKIVGAFPAEILLKGIKYAVEGKNWKMMEKEYNSGERGLDFMMNYLDILAISGEDKKYEEVILNYMKEIPLDSLMNEEVWKLVSPYIDEPESREFQFVLNHLDKFAYKGFERYDLEWTLALKTYYKISDIIEIGFQTENRDTLRQSLDYLRFLDTLLLHDVKSYPEYRAYVRVEESYLEGNALELYDRLIHLGEHGLLKNVDWVKEWVDYLLDNLNSREQIKRCVDYLYQVQQKEERENVWIVKNCYDIIAKGYVKLGDQSQAEEFYKASEALEKQNDEKMDVFK